MALSSAIMIDPYVLYQEYERLKVENDALVQKTRSLDIENRCLKKTIEGQMTELENFAVEISRFKQIVGKDHPCSKTPAIK